MSRLWGIAKWVLLLVGAAVVAGGALALAFPDRILQRIDYSAATERLVTGLLVTGSASRPVVYVTSSDPRTGARNRRDRSMDTNSGTVTRLVWTGSEWERRDLVRGLPRSRQDHATNGLALDETTNTLYVAQGSNTNRGAPSDRFAGLPETPLSGSILAIDLDRISETTYDLPTRRGRGPFGGLNGANAAILDPNGPVRLYATGLRNPYDLVLTQTGELLATDNGANTLGGDRPIDCTATTRNGGTRGLDSLYRIVEGGFFGHPNPSRRECGVPDQAPLASFPFSTNGIAEVRAGPFAGDLLTVSFDGTLRRIHLAGGRVATVDRVDVQGIPLDVATEGKGDSRPGVIWVASYADVGGRQGSITALEPTWLDRSGPWATLPASGPERQEVSYVNLGGRLILAGGSTTHEAFDPESGTWTELAPLPEQLDHIQGAVLGGRVYYVGGLRRWPDEEVGSVLVYDARADSFSSAPAMPRPRGAGGVVAHGGKLYYAGGLARGDAVAWFDVYDPAARQWSRLPDMPRARDHFQAVVVGDRLVVTGGRVRDLGTELSETDVYDIGEGRWQTGLAPIPTPRGGFGAAVVGDEMIVIGGEVPGRALPTVEAYDVRRDSWRVLPSMPTARHGIQVAACGGQLFVAAGGIRAGGGPSDAHEALTLGSACTRQPVERIEAVASVADGYVVSSVSGADPVRPTAVDVGPDGRLYVAQQDGTILVLSVRRRAAGAYEVTATEEIDLVRRIPNHDDDGSSAVDVESLVTVFRDWIGL